MDINTVALTGRLGSDLELRHTKTGTAVANANLAVESGFGDSKKTNWIGLDFWGKSAESASQHLGKGRKIAVSGRLDQSEYEKDGQKVSKTRVVVESWTFADSDRGGSQSASQPSRRETRQEPARREAPAPAQRPAPRPAAVEAGDDDIPFAPFWKHSPMPL